MSKRVLRNRLLKALDPPKEKPYVCRPPRYNEAERRLDRWLELRISRGFGKRYAISLYMLSERSGIPVRRLLAMTKDAPFRLDFGRDRRGRLLTYFKERGPRGFEAWARRLDVAS